MDNLVIQGIITFFTGFPLTVYERNKTITSSQSIEYPKKDRCIKIDGNDYSQELSTLLNELNAAPSLIITLLDRWRKAIYMKNESCDADLYYDEVTLNFFHILELLSENVADELKSELENNIKQMLYKQCKLCFYNDTRAKQFEEQNFKSVKKLLIGEHLNLSSKIKYFLDKYQLLDDNVAFFIDNMIRVRNVIAHGKITFQRKFIWPLTPFFSLAKDSYEDVDLLFVLTAVMIARFIGIKRWDNDWKYAKTLLMPPKNIIKKYLINELDDEISSIQLSCGNDYNITWKTLFKYYIENPNESTFGSIQERTRDEFLHTEVDEENAPDIFNISVVFADAYDEEIKKKAINNIKTIIKDKTHMWSSIKDIVQYLDYYSIDITWYKNFLLNGEYLAY